jgi:hypothetical protein
MILIFIVHWIFASVKWFTEKISADRWIYANFKNLSKIEPGRMTRGSLRGPAARLKSNCLEPVKTGSISADQ